MKKVTVVYASEQGIQKTVSLDLPSDASVQSAIEQSGLLDMFAEIDLSAHAVGIYGQVVSLQTIVQDDDRIEIYRPLKQSPMEQRKTRLAQNKATKTGT